MQAKVILNEPKKWLNTDEMNSRTPWGLKIVTRQDTSLSPAQRTDLIGEPEVHLLPEPELKYGNVVDPLKRAQKEQEWRKRCQETEAENARRKVDAQRQLYRKASFDPWLSEIVCIAMFREYGQDETFSKKPGCEQPIIIFSQTWTDTGEEFGAVDEREMLSRFLDFVTHVRPVLPITGHRVRSFDLQTILTRAMLLGVIEPYEIASLRSAWMGPQWKTEEYVYDTSEYFPGKRFDFLIRRILKRDGRFGGDRRDTGQFLERGEIGVVWMRALMDAVCSYYIAEDALLFETSANTGSSIGRRGIVFEEIMKQIGPRGLVSS